MSVKLDILAFGSHPDDVELSAAGTIVKHINKGLKVGIVDLTRGELGSRGSAEIRDEEAKKASKVLGLSIRENLDLGDGFFEINDTSLKKIIQSIRKYQPNLILCNAPKDRHPDHARGSELVNRAAFLSGLSKIETVENGKLQQAWRAKSVLMYIQDYHLEPSIVIDITNEFNKKIESIMCFSSQFYDPNSIEPKTPISGEDFQEYIKSRCSYMGRIINAKYGEGFISNRALGVENLLDLI